MGEANKTLFKDKEKYEILKFNIDKDEEDKGKDEKTNLYTAFNNGIYLDDKIKTSRLVDYLWKYFHYESDANEEIGKKEDEIENLELKAKHILIEKEYLSESYLNDIRFFYWMNFRNYLKFCRRIHFFKDFNKAEFESAVLNKNKQFFKSIYLGYVVVKPTGNSLFGPTFLKTYESNSNRLRYYNSTIKMKVNLFGINIPIKGLVFQEQDQAIGVCATQAIWTALNKVSSLFRVPMLSPGEISEYGGIGTNGRIFPNSGLSNKQIFKIFSRIGLTATHLSTNRSNGVGQQVNRYNLKEIVYAYNKIGIPILLGYYSNTGNNKRDEKKKSRHLVTIVGYRIRNMKDSLPKDNPLGKIITKNDRIMRLYVHNDQIGPYTK
ncbi:MAG: hypothetical protein L3J47_10680, partial [Sulfurovum sp.]|nr:hypothetical protein [Sulfurovum sp.]